MEHKITVYNENGDVLGTTFNRRAKQLIIKNRAIWLDSTHTSICLAAPDSKEDGKLYTEDIGTNRQNYETPASEHDFLHEEDKLLRLAQKKVKERQKLINYVIYYIFGTAILIVIAIQSYDFFIGTCLGVWMVWSAFILNRIIKYFARYAKAISITKHFKQDPVEAEYIKLKRMNPEQIAREYGKM